MGRISGGNGQLFDAGHRVFSPANLPSWHHIQDRPTAMVNGGHYDWIKLNRLHLDGSGGLRFETYGGGFYMSDTTWIRTYGTKKFHINNGENDAINVSGGIWAGQGVTAYSDKRLKRNFRPIYDATDMCKQLRGCTYELKSDLTGRRHYGFIAQEVQKVLPEIVLQDGDGQYLGLQYHGVIPVLLEAIKELDIRLQTLESKTA